MLLCKLQLSNKYLKSVASATAGMVFKYNYLELLQRVSQGCRLLRTEGGTRRAGDAIPPGGIWSYVIKSNGP